jgi:hypothetical protein
MYWRGSSVLGTDIGIVIIGNSLSLFVCTCDGGLGIGTPFVEDIADEILGPLSALVVPNPFSVTPAVPLGPFSYPNPLEV